MNISFLLPEDNRSGGIRVTSIMAERLRNRGHNVRILLINKPTLYGTLKARFKQGKHRGWLHQFGGTVQVAPFVEKVSFQRGELVVGVGTYTLDYLAAITADVVKLRYNHGLPAVFDEQAQRVWSLQLPSITVSGSLVPRLEELCPGSVRAVVPNGIDSAQYHDLKIERNGVGIFYNSHPNKAPDFIVDILTRLRNERPELPIYMISAQSRPAELSFTDFHYLPSVEKVCEIYNRCNLWMLPSDTEGLPGPVLEAMSCGTPVVSTDNDGSLEIITAEVNGLISPRRDLDAFITNIYRILDDIDLQNTIAAAGQARAAEFSWDAAVDKMEAVIDGLTTGMEKAS